MWNPVVFMPDEVDPGRPTELLQFNFDLMCAEVMKEESGQWVGVVIDTEGSETWVSHVVDFEYQAKYLVREYLRECFAGWLNEMSREL